MILIPLNKVLLTVAVALVATATLIEACGEDPYAMTACEVMEAAMGGRPHGEKARMMTLSVRDIGCLLPEGHWPTSRPENKATLMQGTTERLIPDR